MTKAAAEMRIAPMQRSLLSMKRLPFHPDTKPVQIAVVPDLISELLFLQGQELTAPGSQAAPTRSTGRQM